MPVDNELYDQLAWTWWDEHEILNALRILLNPGRFGYFVEVLVDRLKIDPKDNQVLDVGCGGGLLAEEFARLGCHVTGIDPSEPSLAVARAHALQEGLAIEYREGVGESLPFADACFDLVYCCDVLEHVNNLEAVISEIARVLKKDGEQPHLHQATARMEGNQRHASKSPRLENVRQTSRAASAHGKAWACTQRNRRIGSRD